MARLPIVTESARLLRTGWGQGTCVGDYDNDGNVDLMVYLLRPERTLTGIKRKWFL